MISFRAHSAWETRHDSPNLHREISVSKLDTAVPRPVQIYITIMVVVGEGSRCSPSPMSFHSRECPSKFFILKNLIATELASLKS